MPTRREFIATGAAAAAASLSPASVGGVRAASVPSRPDHITARDDIDELRRYQPSLIASFQAIDEMTGTYGWIAESEDHDRTAYYYWTKYATQQSWSERWVPWRAPDSHFEDHEPAVVFADEDGAVDTIVATRYHHGTMDLDPTDAQLQARVADDETHVTLKVVDPHHHYKNGADYRSDGVLAENLADFGSWLDVRDGWYKNGIFEVSNVDVIEDPFLLLEDNINDWWADGQRRDKFLAKWGPSLGFD